MQKGRQNTVESKLQFSQLLLFAFTFLLFTFVSARPAFSANQKGVVVNSSQQVELTEFSAEEIVVSKSRTQHFADGDIGEYIVSLFSPYFSYSRMSYVAALLIFLIYLFYFRYIDIYEHEPWKYLLLTVLAGIFFADIGLIFYDFAYVILGLSISGSFLGDLFYSVFIIGGIEELVKIIPLLLLLRYTKIINEPIDYIVYGGVSALGFAFSENVMYFDNHGAGIILGRALTAVVLHTGLTAIVAYGLVLRDYRQQKYAPLRLYLVAITLHGLYDFFMINDTARSLIIVSYAILFSTITMFNNIVANSLSNSPYYNKGVHLEIRKIQRLLVGGLVGIIAIQFIMLSVSESASAAKEGFSSSIVLAVVMIPALTMRFSRIELHPKKWKSIPIPFLFTKVMLDDVPDDMTGIRMELYPMTRNMLMMDYFPNTGAIYKQHDDSKKRRWYYVRLGRTAQPSDFNNAHIVIRSKFGNELFNKNGLGMAGIYLINKTTNKPEFIGWASLKELV